MGKTIIKTGALPYDDGSGFMLDIEIEAPSEIFKYHRVVLNPDLSLADFPVEKWPEVKAAIDRAINALSELEAQENS